LGAALPDIEVTQIRIHDNAHCVTYNVYPEGETPIITAGYNQIHIPEAAIKIRNNTNTYKLAHITVLDAAGNLIYEEDIALQPGAEAGNGWEAFRDMISDTSITVEAGYWASNMQLIITDRKTVPIILGYILTIASASGGTTDPPAGTYIIQHDSKLTVTAYPLSGYRFSHWLLDSQTITDNPATILTDKNYTLTPVFEALPPPSPSHTLTVNSTPVNVQFTIDTKTATTPYTETLQEGTYTITMPQTWKDPATGKTYKFNSWEDGSTNPTRTITLTADTTVTANYAEAPTYTLTVVIQPENAGTVTLNPPNGAYPEGASVIATATPASGYKFSRWLLDSQERTENPTTITMDKNYTLTAVFTQLPTYKLTIAVNDPTMGTTNPPPGEYTYTEGSSVTVQAIPYTGYTFTNWTLDGQTRTENPITITIDKDYTLTANFQPAPAGVTITGTVKGLLGRPVSGATVTLNGQSTTTDPSGKYTFTGLTPAVYRITVEHWLYETQSKAITATETKTYTVDFQLSLKTPYLTASLSILGIIAGFITYKTLFPSPKPPKGGKT
jgi:uncharacterized repeat protein (TIGR02543 family)